MDSNATDLIFGQRDGLASAKLMAVFALHMASLALLFVMAHGQPSSTLGRFTIITGRWHGRLALAAALAALIAAASLIADRQAGMTTVLFLNAGVLALYVIEYSILLSRGFFKRLLGDDLQAELRLFICFVVMTNAGYFTLMFLKDILLSDSLGVG
ncbi:MAG: hypothetical protein VW495_01660 [Rhodobiaceae bacterium]|jgi:hypothetical protein